MLSDKIAEGEMLQCDFCRTNFVGQNRCSTPVISGTLYDKKGKGGGMRTWYQDDYVGGFIDENGHFDVCEEYNLSDADSDKYAVEVQNHDGYYDFNGNYVAFAEER